MILANELRVGNWVDYKGKYYQIYDGIRSLSIDDLDSEKLDSHLKNIKLSELQPIPLTEEILLKCGFESSDFYRTHYFKYEEIDNNLKGDVFCFNITRNRDFFNNEKTLSFSFKPFGLHLKYLHQLQNIYFALTGQELEINL